MARRKLFDRPMTAAQRQQRRREKVKTELTAMPAELRLRQDFYRWLELYLLTRPEMRRDINMVSHAISAVLKNVCIADFVHHTDRDHDAEQWLYDAVYCPATDDGLDGLYDAKDREPIPHVIRLLGVVMNEKTDDSGMIAADGKI